LKDPESVPLKEEDPGSQHQPH